jgi:hypothetical protein
MLHEFYEQAKADGKTCHATYILSGLVEQVPPDSGDAMQIDDYPMSSPLATQESSKSISSLTKSIRSITLADEETVQGNHSWE